MTLLNTMKKKLLLILIILTSNLSFAYEQYKEYDYTDVKIIRVDNLKDNNFTRYIYVFRKSDNVLILSKLCIKEMISNKIEYDICNESRMES